MRHTEMHQTTRAERVARTSMDWLLHAIGADPAFTDAVIGDLAEERAKREAASGRMAARLWLPEGADDAALRKALLETYGIEVGGGLGEFAGKAWRIGLMGHSARDRSVTAFLGALRELLA